MSTSVFVKFFVDKKAVAKTVCLNMLKNMLDSYSCEDELLPTNEPDIKGADEYWYEDFKGYINFEKVPENMKSRLLETARHTELHLEKNETISQGLFEEAPNINKRDSNKKYVCVFCWKKEKYKGMWFDEDSFMNAQLRYEKKLNESSLKLNKLLSLKDSIEYYKLTEEQQQNLYSDIEYCRDEFEEYNKKVYTCKYMIDTFEMFTDMYSENYSDKCMAFIWIG